MSIETREDMIAQIDLLLDNEDVESSWDYLLSVQEWVKKNGYFTAKQAATVEAIAERAKEAFLL